MAADPRAHRMKCSRKCSRCSRGWLGPFGPTALWFRQGLGFIPGLSLLKRILLVKLLLGHEAGGNF